MTVLVVSPGPQGEQIKVLLEDEGYQVETRSDVNLAIESLNTHAFERLIIVPQAGFEPWPLVNLLRSTDNKIAKIPIVIISNESNWSYQRLMLNYYDASALLSFNALSRLPGMLRDLYHTPFKPKIMVVDDNPVSLEHISRFLKPLYDVSGFNSGAEALRVFKPERFDLVMVDLRMPKMNGFTLIEKLLEIDPAVLTLALSAEMDLEASIRLHQLGAAGAYSKSKMQSVPLNHAIHSLFLQRHKHFLLQNYQLA